MIPGGQLRDRITLRNPADVANTSGGFTEGTPTEYSNVPALVEELSAAASLQFQKYGQRVSHRITIGMQVPAPEEDWEIDFNGETIHVSGVRSVGRGSGYELMGSEERP